MPTWSGTVMGDVSTVDDMEGAVAEAVGPTLTRRTAVVVAERWNAGAGEKKADAAARPLMSTRAWFIVAVRGWSRSGGGGGQVCPRAERG